MKREVKEIVKRWLEKAEKDLKTCRRELNYIDPVIETVAFHAQQAVEKYLKAFLASHNIPFGKTHNIAKLIEMCSRIDGDFEYLFEIDADTLYPIGITIRYPSDFEISVSEARDFVKTAEKVKEFVLKKIER